MSMIHRVILFSAIVVTLNLATGCAGLSLFSSTHTHYDTSPDVKDRIDNLEHRVSDLENNRTTQPQ